MVVCLSIIIFLHRPYLLRNHVSKLDILQTADGRRAMVVHQLVQGIELHHPEEELARRVAQDLEVLYAIWTSAKRDWLKKSVKSLYNSKISSDQVMS